MVKLLTTQPETLTGRTKVCLSNFMRKFFISVMAAWYLKDMCWAYQRIIHLTSSAYSEFNYLFLRLWINLSPCYLFSPINVYNSEVLVMPLLTILSYILSLIKQIWYIECFSKSFNCWPFCLHFKIKYMRKAFINSAWNYVF